MSKDEKIQSLIVYQSNIKDRLNSSTPTKHQHREAAYRQYLNRELEQVTQSIEALKANA